MNDVTILLATQTSQRTDKDMELSLIISFVMMIIATVALLVSIAIASKQSRDRKIDLFKQDLLLFKEAAFSYMAQVDIINIINALNETMYLFFSSNICSVDEVSKTQQRFNADLCKNKAIYFRLATYLHYKVEDYKLIDNLEKLSEKNTELMVKIFKLIGIGKEKILNIFDATYIDSLKSDITEYYSKVVDMQQLMMNMFIIADDICMNKFWMKKVFKIDYLLKEAEKQYISKPVGYKANEDSLRKQLDDEFAKIDTLKIDNNLD